ncbi:endothelial cell-specific chemotaxis regulator isoform X2 [Urocitellus parryii]|uniref:Endothelial cell surface expressed chemotaxis and apoptosis regulator n=1 Tax=Urocitellus parryii TaxID=9999 RepID=A0A8D2IHP7_UROPR|nr:endothelial cell-specific chemotaxis regulator isoform X2 [Urocitellus parryii]
MGTIGARQLCWAILGLLFLQGPFSSLSLVTEPTSPNTGEISSSEFGSPRLLFSSSIPGTGAPHSSSSSGGGGSSAKGETSQNDTSNSVTMDSSMMEDLTILPSPTLATVLTVAAFGVISFIVILVVVVIILVAVVSLRFKCRKNKESEDPQKPGSSGLSESCSTANGEKESITLISMKNINMNNSKGCPSAEKVL